MELKKKEFKKQKALKESLEKYELNEIRNDPEVLKAEFSEQDFASEDEKTVFESLPPMKNFKISLEQNSEASTNSLFIPKSA